MGYCVAYKDDTQEKCGETTAPGRKYCEDHGRVRKGATNEVQNQAIDNLVDATQLFNDPGAEVVKADNENAVRTIPNEQRNIYDKTNDALNKMIDHEEKMAGLVATLSPEELRYQDKAGAEQLHSYMALHERAMDRVLRGVTAIAKLNIDAQSVNVNKMIRELIKTCVSKAMVRAGYDQNEIQTVRQYLAEEFEKASEASNA